MGIANLCPANMPPKETISDYYLDSSARMITCGRVGMYYSKETGARYRSIETGKFISLEKFNEIMEEENRKMAPRIEHGF